jgi:hypothetical protein
LRTTCGLWINGHIHLVPVPRTDRGKLERFQETPKASLNLLVYTNQGRLHAALADFIDF